MSFLAPNGAAVSSPGQCEPPPWVGNTTTIFRAPTGRHFWYHVGRIHKETAAREPPDQGDRRRHRTYHAALKHSRTQAAHEGATETAFSRLLIDTGKLHGWTLIPKKRMKVGGKLIYPDSTFQDGNFLPRGYREAKDTADDLDEEIIKKAETRHRLTKSFSRTRKAVVPFQNGAGGRGALHLTYT